MKIKNPAVKTEYGRATFVVLSSLHLVLALVIVVFMLLTFAKQKQYQYLIICFLAVKFMAAQYTAIRQVKANQPLHRPSWLFLGSLSLSIVFIPLLISNALPVSLSFLLIIPVFFGATTQYSQLPTALFISFAVAALTTLVNILHPFPTLSVEMPHPYFLSYHVVGLVTYFGILLAIVFNQRQKRGDSKQRRVNLATQYALVISTISAMAIFLVTSVLVSQIRLTQINQVGRNFQTIAENFAKLSGSHLEQQMQKLLLITEQIPSLKESLLQANSQYNGNNTNIQDVLLENNVLWQGMNHDSAFIMHYLNNPITETLSRFRGHNSFHNDIVLVDQYGGLVASLGQKPKSFHFFDEHWWNVSWNRGLGNIYIGDLEIDDRTRTPKLRIAIPVVNHSTNGVIGFLSSKYLLRTLIEDIQRFKPDTVEQISLINSDGLIISTTGAGSYSTVNWEEIKNLASSNNIPDSGWNLGDDLDNRKALIGYSSLSTVYSVISDPLHRLGWYIVVSGSQSSALAGVTQSTKLAMLVGLAAMALGVLGAIAAARVITRPIENLTATASAMSGGDLEKRADPTGPEELVALSEGFNKLTGQLHKLINNLQSQTIQLAKAKSEAEVATKLKGEFLTNMSHEIRTPLNAILGFADILESSIKEEVQKKHAHTIKTSGSDLLHLINDILDLSKIEAGRMEIKRTSVDIRTLFAELNRIFSISAAEKNITIELEVTPEVPKLLLLDSVRLKQVLFNLVGNAVKFTEKGAVLCRAHVTRSQYEDFWDLFITVRDTGIGIGPENYSTVFETFRQGDDNPPARKQGTGLGLAISKSLIEMMGGTIMVEGKRGVGTTFSVHLPKIADTSRSYESTAADTEAEYEEKITFEPASLLVIDDLEINRKLIVENLKHHPLKITESHSGRDGIAKVEENRFTAILMDIRMPEMDGYTTLQRIREIPHFQQIPVIAITASGMTEEIARIEQSGFTDYLIRPFNQSALIKVLAGALPHHSEKKETPVEKISAPSTANDYTEPWVCPGHIAAYISNTLKTEWEHVLTKQSIPEIQGFAEKVKETGNKNALSVLTHFGEKLEEYADSFDIDKLEKHLLSFEIVIGSLVIEEAAQQTTNPDE